MLRIASIILIFLLNLGLSYAQQSDVQSTLSKALEFYRDEKLDQAWELLTEVDTPQSELLKVKILTKQASFQQAFDRVLPLTEHPLPALRDDALFTLAVIQFYRKEVKQTLEITFELKKFSKSAVLRRDASIFFYETINWLTVQQSAQITREVNLQDLKFEIFKYHLGKLDKSEASIYVQTNKRWFDKNYSSAISEIERLLVSDVQFKRYKDDLRSDKFSHHYYTIGIILPDHPKRHELYNVSRSLYGGIQVWIDQYNKNNKNTSFRLSFFRLKPNLENADDLNTWMESESIDAIIGPINSDAVKVVADRLNDHAIPILAPLANDPQLTDQRKYLFQLNPGVEQRANAYAHFVVARLGLKNVAIITDQDPLSRLEADFFKKEFLRLGGSISHDFGNQINSSESELRKSFTVLSSQQNAIEVQEKGAEALLFVSSNQDAKRLFDRSVAALDAVGSRVTLLGTQNLNYVAIPTRVKRDYEVYTYSPYDENPIGKTVSDLKSAYKSYVEFEPDIYTYIGLDSASMISSLAETAKNPSLWVQELQKMTSFRGLAIPGSFDSGRINRDVYFYRLNSSGKERIDFSVDQ